MCRQRLTAFESRESFWINEKLELDKRLKELQATAQANVAVEKRRHEQELIAQEEATRKLEEAADLKKIDNPELIQNLVFFFYLKICFFGVYIFF